MFIKKPRCKILKEKGQPPVVLDVPQNNTESLLSFCKRQTSNGKCIMSMEHAGNSSTQVIVGSMGVSHNADFSMTLYLVESGPIPIKLCTIRATYQEEGISKSNLITIKKGIYINDIEVWKVNKGYGSLLLEFMINFCRENEFNYISGFLAPVDTKDHPERLYHFYQKHGFTITDTDDPDTKNIVLKFTE